MHNLKRYIAMLFGIWALLLGMMSQAQAWQGNWLLGASVGMARHIEHDNINLSYSRIPLFPTTYLQENYRYRSASWGVLAGYQLTCADFLVEGEGNLNWFGNHKSRTVNITDLINAVQFDVHPEYKQDATLGFTGRMGYAMSSYFLPYIVLGVEGSHDAYSVSYTRPPFSTDSETQRWAYRFIAGVGTQIPLDFCRALSVRIEYNCHLPYTYLQTNSAMVDGLVNPLFSSQSKPKIQEIKVALVWKRV